MSAGIITFKHNHYCMLMACSDGGVDRGIERLVNPYGVRVNLAISPYNGA